MKIEIEVDDQLAAQIAVVQAMSGGVLTPEQIVRVMAGCGAAHMVGTAGTVPLPGGTVPRLEGTVPGTVPRGEGTVPPKGHRAPNVPGHAEGHRAPVQGHRALAGARASDSSGLSDASKVGTPLENSSSSCVYNQQEEEYPGHRAPDDPRAPPDEELEPNLVATGNEMTLRDRVLRLDRLGERGGVLNTWETDFVGNLADRAKAGLKISGPQANKLKQVEGRIDRRLRQRRRRAERSEEETKRGRSELDRLKAEKAAVLAEREAEARGEGSDQAAELERLAERVGKRLAAPPAPAGPDPDVARARARKLKGSA